MTPRSVARRLGVGLVVLAARGGCARALRYTPAAQPAGVRLAADYRVVGDRLRVAIESGGYPVEDALILRGDGAIVRPLAIEPPGAAGGSGVGIGVGVGSVGRSGSVSIGTGVGVGTGIGVGGRRGAVAVFPLDQVGPAPWTLHLKVAGIQPVVILLPAERG